MKKKPAEFAYPSLTTEERRAVRQEWLTAGYVRVFATHDDGDGAYTEVWKRRDFPAQEIHLVWEPKKQPAKGTTR